MADLMIFEKIVGAAGVNCYFFVNTETRETIITDPGGNATALMAYMTKYNMKPVVVLLTHAHYDHAHHAAAISKAYNIPVYCHEAEAATLTDTRMNCSLLFGDPEKYTVDGYFKDGQEVEFAGFKFTVIHTPGHTPGGCCYYFAEQKKLLSGDTLFNMSVGRTDFPGGSMSQLVRSIRDKLLVLPRDVDVLPGHMSHTTIATEIEYNPFL